jgi:hypothetical protein
MLIKDQFLKKISVIYIYDVFFFENSKYVNIHIKLTKHNNLIYTIYFLI